ncbi:hypothetical protein [Actinoalloteichus caeruleus]|uniref:hypothetical protein n=1 Tax=Actinoalloteichus cyanogriseus TaxID=2893586 RepID=UPI00068A2D1A|nr:hypothetical protein [Actinoalloteichus caeruleus]
MTTRAFRTGVTATCVLLALAGCAGTGTPATSGPPYPSASSAHPEPRLGSGGPSAEDGPAEAGAHHHPAQDQVGELEAALVAQEPDRFGGAWIGGYEPEFRVVVALTEVDPRPTALDDFPDLVDHVTLTRVEFAALELEAARARAEEALTEAGVLGGIGVHPMDNRVLVEVAGTDVDEAEQAVSGIAGVTVTRVPDLPERYPGLGVHETAPDEPTGGR